jgi:hypothetical protein
MSQAAIIGVVVLMMMSSSASAVLMMGGDDDKKTGPTGPTGPTPPPPPPVEVFTLDPKSTPNNDAGGGNMIYLDRHDITCDKKPINQFKLNYPSASQMKYDYKCISSFDDQTLVDKQTPSNDWGGGNMIFADRHVVDCQTKPITRLHLTRPASNKIAYEYKCGNTTSNSCREATSAETAEISSNKMLTNLDVACNDGEYLSKVHLTRKSPGKFHYKYTCCT